MSGTSSSGHLSSDYTSSNSDASPENAVSDGGYTYVNVHLTENQLLTVSAGQTSYRTSTVIPALNYLETGGPNTTAPEEDVYGSSLDTYVYGGAEYVFSGGISTGAVISGTYYDANEDTLIAGELSMDDGARAYDVTAEGYAFVVVGGDYPPHDSDPAILSGATIGSGAELDVWSDGSASNVTVEAGGRVVLNTYDSHWGTITDLSASVGAAINLVDLRYVSGGTAVIVGDPTLVVTEGGVTSSIPLTGDYTGKHFVLSDDGSGGTLATLEDGTPCYCRGTLIATEAGEVPVEDLRIGDHVRTASGALRPIRWIGHRSYSGRFAARNRDVLPVVFRAGSLGNGLPRRDLAVSPLHAMFLDGVLIPAVALVNGHTIVHAEMIDEVSYVHVELDSHDVLLAEGAPSESFVDDDSRNMFHNACTYRALYPKASRQPALYCAPRVEEGPQLEAVRQRLAGLTGITTADAPASRVEGYVDTVTRTTITGWARDPTSEATVRLRITINGVTLGTVLADTPRPDLGASCGFCFTVTGGLSPATRHIIEVRPVSEGASLGNTPWVLDLPAVVFPVPAATMTLRGCLDVVTRERIAGWACDPDDPGQAVALQIIVNGRFVASTIANGRRPDVAASGHGPERCGFAVLMPEPLSPLARHVVEMRRETDGAPLGAPVAIEAAAAFDADLERAVSLAVASVEDGATRQHVMSFLAARMEQLRQARAEAHSGQSEALLNRERSRRGLAVPTAPWLRALVIDARLPDARRDAGSVAILSHMRALQVLGYAVSFVAADEAAADGREVAPDITVLGLPFLSSVEDMLRRQADGFDIVILHRQDVATRYLPLVRRYQRRAHVLYSIADLHHLRLARQAQVEQRPELLARARLVRAAELSAAAQADAVLTHSSAEAALLCCDLPGANVHVVPWAVPVRSEMPGFDERCGVAFIGNFTHAPNVDAAVWLVEAIMPLVWARAPEITCLIAGAEMPERITRLAQPGVTIVGSVDDLGDVLDRIRLTVAPLRYGAGIKGKVLESLAAGVPCVMTPIAAEGIGLPDALAQFVGKEADALAVRIIAMHGSREAYVSVARAGQDLVRARHNEGAVTVALRGALRPAAVVARKVG